MRHKIEIGNFILILSTVLFIQASGCWSYVAPEKFAARCPIIIDGRIERIKGPYSEEAIIKVFKIHKNILTNIHLAANEEFIVNMDPVGKGWENSTDIRYCLNKDGIWLVTLKQDGTFSIAEHPVQYQCSSAEKKLRKQGVFRNQTKKMYSKTEWIEAMRK